MSNDYAIKRFAGFQVKMASARYNKKIRCDKTTEHASVADKIKRRWEEDVSSNSNL